MRRHPRWAGAMLVVLVLGGIGLGVWYMAWRHRGQERPDDSGTSHWQQAQQATEARDFDLAKEHLGRCLETWPFSAEAHFLMARTCRRLNDMKGWRTHLDRARLLQWPADQIDLEERLKEAQIGDVWLVERPLLDYLASSPPDEVLVMEALVKGYLENDRPHDASNLAETWLQRYPDDWEARLYHGRAFQWGAIFDKALADYEKVLAVEPDRPEAHLWMGETLLSSQQFEQAMEHYRVYLRSHPDDADVLWGLAKCEYNLGRMEEARATLDEVLRREPKNVPGLLLSAKLEQAESPRKALALLRRARALAPDNTELLHNFVLALRQLHQGKEADKYERLLNERKEKLRKLTKLQVDMLNDANNVNLRYRAGVLALDVGLEDEAAHLFQTVLWMDPGHRPTHRALADYLEKHGNARRAAYHRARAEGKHPAATPAR